MTVCALELPIVNRTRFMQVFVRPRDGGFSLSTSWQRTPQRLYAIKLLRDPLNSRLAIQRRIFYDGHRRGKREDVIIAEFGSKL